MPDSHSPGLLSKPVVLKLECDLFVCNSKSRIDGLSGSIAIVDLTAMSVISLTDDSDSLI